MIRAVFFDWFNTLAYYEPPRENLVSQAFKEVGIDIAPDAAGRGLLIADRNYIQENILSPIRERSPEEQTKAYTRYQKTILAEAGISAPDELLLKVMGRLQELYSGMTFALFDDVLPTLKTLKERKLTMGLLTNLQSEISPICEKLGVTPYLDFIVTSKEAGADKPEPPIFRLALERAGVDAPDVIHVGDQYGLDVAGARRAGINPILIDRSDIYPDVDDCPRIHGLDELNEYLT